MNEELTERLEDFRDAVTNNQLYLAMRNLRDVVNYLVEEVAKDEPTGSVAAEEPKEEPAEKKTPARKSKRSSAVKSTPKDSDEEVSE